VVFLWWANVLWTFLIDYPYQISWIFNIFLSFIKKNIISHALYMFFKAIVFNDITEDFLGEAPRYNVVKTSHILINIWFCLWQLKHIFSYYPPVFVVFFLSLSKNCDMRLGPGMNKITEYIFLRSCDFYYEHTTIN
jgi:hypothetical protein